MTQTSLSLTPLTIQSQGYADPSFGDGNVLIRSEDSYVFRVHQSVLWHSTPALLSCRNFTYKEGVNTLAVIEVTEKRDQFSLFLRAVYDGIYTPEMRTLDRLKTVYALAHRYTCTMVSNRCRTLLDTFLIPSDLAKLSRSLPPPVGNGRQPAYRSDFTFQFNVDGLRWPCHYGILARRSSVLRPIIERELVAGTRLENGCVVLKLTAEAEAVPDFIAALYYGFYFEKPTSTNMSKYTSVLKLAQQFDVVELRREIKGQFRRLYPPSFKGFCELKAESPILLAQLKNQPRPLQLFLIAQECNMVEVLHEAHYELSRSPPPGDGIHKERASPGKDGTIALLPEYATRFQEGRRAMRHKWDGFIANLRASRDATAASSARGGSGLCRHPKVCARRLVQAIDGTSSFDDHTPETCTDWTTLFAMLKEEWAFVSGEMRCKACTAWVDTLVTDGEKEFWDVVPRVFGFEDLLAGRVSVSHTPMVKVTRG